MANYYIAYSYVSAIAFHEMYINPEKKNVSSKNNLQQEIDQIVNEIYLANVLLLLLLSYHRRLRMILRSARAARGRRSG